MSKTRTSRSVYRPNKAELTVQEVFEAVRRDWEAAGPGGLLGQGQAPVDDVAGRLAFLWKASRLGQEEMAAAFGVSHSAFKGWLAGRTQPQLDNLVRIREVAGVSVQWLATGEGPIFWSRSAASGEPIAGFVYVPRYDLRVGAGARGQVVDTASLKGFLAFREDWVRSRLRRNPTHLAVLEAFGDSMVPTIKDGDIMLVDLSENIVRGPAIYAVVAGDSAIVKRIELKLDGSLLVKSDNPTYEPITLRGQEVNDLRVIGKVVWAGGLV